MSWKLPSDMPRESGTTKKTGEFRGFGLPARLQAVASCVGIGARIVDVGTDHGLLPIALVGSGRASKAIAADLRPQPLDMARQNVQRFGPNCSHFFQSFPAVPYVRPSLSPPDPPTPLPKKERDVHN